MPSPSDHDCDVLMVALTVKPLLQLFQPMELLLSALRTAVIPWSESVIETCPALMRKFTEGSCQWRAGLSRT